MPGPVSDAYDPEFGTRENADTVREAMRAISHRLTEMVFHGNGDLLPIVGVAELALSKGSPRLKGAFTESQWRVIRFALNRAAEEI